MNFLLIPTLLLAGSLFWVGGFLARRNPAGFRFFVSCAIGVVLSVPGIVYAAYYLKIFSEPIWLYRFRSVPFSELYAGGGGFLAGYLHGKFSGSAKFRRVAGGRFFPGILTIVLLAPYLKPIVRPPHWDLFQDRWSDGVCLQTSESSCGPACAATLLHRLGKSATEKEIARTSFTSRSGTENWYLARTLRRNGLGIQFKFERDLNQPWPYPAIAGTRLRGSGNAGHFVTVLDRSGDKYVIGDPLEGRIVGTPSELSDTYEFTGFFLVTY